MTVALRRPLRIAIVAPFPIRKLYPEQCDFTKGGREHSATWIVNLVRELGKAPSVQVHLVTVKSHLARDSRFCRDGVHFHILRGARNTLQPITLYEFDRRKLVEELRIIGPDVVESFGTEGPFSYAGVTSGFPCIIKIQGIVGRNLKEMGFRPTDYLWWRYCITQFIERRTFQLCTDVIADNDFMASFALAANRNVRVHPIPNLIEPLFFRVRQDWGKQRNAILYVGSLKREKGVFELVEAFGEMRSSGVHAELRLIGSGSTGATRDLRGLVARRGLDDSVHLLGSQSHKQIAQQMQESAFLVHPCWVDYSPNSVYEAMIAGLGVIASNVGGLPYMVDEGKTGYLVEARNVTALAEQMKRLLSDSAEQQRLGSNAMRKMRERFDRTTILENLLSAYRQMMWQQRQVTN